MSCEQYGILISKWVDGEAKPEDMARLEAHLPSCAACRGLAEEFRRNNDLVESACGPESFGQQVAGGVLGAIARRETVLRWGARLAVAAGLLGAFLFWRADREAERAQVQRQVESALRVVQQLEGTLAARNRGPEVVREIVREPYFVYVTPDGTPLKAPAPVPGGGGEPLAAQDPPRERPPLDHPGTIAMDRVDASVDGDTGYVNLSWRMDRAPGSMWFVYRRVEGDTDFGSPMNAEPLTSPAFEDRTARGLTTYEYCVVALSNGVFFVADETAMVTAPPDVRVEFKGLGKVDGRTSAVFGIRLRQGGKWSDETSWRPQPGDEQPETGIVFKGVAYARKPYTMLVQRSENGRTVYSEETFYETVPLSTLITPAGPVALWSGWSAKGSFERLEIEDRRR